MKEALHNFHVPLPEDLYRELRAEAKRAQQPATVVARHAIAQWLQQQQKATLHERIRAYAEQHAGTLVDLNLDLEHASVEHLLAEEDHG
jgi:predicted transcriptional regulator